MKILIAGRLGDILGEINIADIPRRGETLRFRGYSGDEIEGYVDMVVRDYTQRKPVITIRLTHVLFGT